MLRRSNWSSVVLSVAVATVGLSCGGAWAQTAPATAPVAAAVETPAAAAATDVNLEKLTSDLLHFSLVNNIELAKANAEALVAAKPAPADLLAAFEATANGTDFRDVLVRDLPRKDLTEAVTKVLDTVDEGFRQVARDPVRIRSDIDRLSNGPRPYQNAKDRLTAAGQYAVPIYLEYLQKNEKKELHPFIIRVMGEIGRPLLVPLIEELRVADPTLRIGLVNVIGQIGYPQALPALRALQLDSQASPQLKTATEKAIEQIDRTGRAGKMSPTELFLAGGENYYGKRASYAPMMPTEKTNPVWYFDANLNNVAPVQVPTASWSDVMALRMAEAAIQADAENGAAISLWLAANLKREIELPAGAADPSRSAGSQDAAFYAMAAGPGFMNPVLARALDTNDSPLALRAMTALEATGGVSGLVADADSPLVRALSHSDRAVRFKAAFALARANPLTQFPSYFRVVPVLCEAVNASAAPSVLLVVKEDGLRNALTNALRSSEASYTVYGGDTMSSALAQASESLFGSSFAAAAAAAAAAADGVPARFSSTQPIRLRWGDTLMARAPGGTSLRTTVPAPV